MRKYYLAAAIAVSALVSCGGSASGTPDTPSGKKDDPTPEPPAVADTTLRIDETLAIHIGGKGASLGSEGRICIYNRKDDSLVDYVDFADMSTVDIRPDGQFVPKAQMTAETVFNTMMDAIGPDGKSVRRIVHCTPVRIAGDTLYFKPHSHKLAYGTDYYVTADAKVVSGVDFPGLAKGGMTFRTCDKPQAKAEITVAKTGKADFRTVQGAIDYAASLSQSGTRTIVIGEGLYQEMLFIRDNDNLTLKAASGATVEIAYANCEAWVNGTGGSVGSAPAPGKAIGKAGGRPVILVENCDMLTFQALVLRNTFGAEKGQAEVIYNNDNSGKCRMVIKSCELWSYQDTFLTKGYAWVFNTLIAGHCDFIWGYPKTCLFENCEIRALAKGYMVQCRCASASDKGFVFLKCRLTAGAGVADGAMTLGRSAGQDTAFDNVAYINCSMSPVIAAGGWHTSPAPNPSKATATSGWREYGSTDAAGKGLSLSGRASCAKILSADEAASFLTRKDIFAGAPFADTGWLE